MGLALYVLGPFATASPLQYSVSDDAHFCTKHLALTGMIRDQSIQDRRVEVPIFSRTSAEQPCHILEATLLRYQTRLPFFYGPPRYILLTPAQPR